MDRPIKDASLVCQWFGQYDYRTNETRFLILEYILGHPTNLPSANELTEMLPDVTLPEIKEELQELVESDYVTTYDAPKHSATQYGPTTYYGLTPEGIDVLDKHDFLQITPLASCIYDNMAKPERVQKYENAPRPEINTTVRETVDSLRNEV